MKKKFIGIFIILLLMLLVMSGCSDSILEGDVYKKEFKPAYTTVMLIPVTITNGDTVSTMMIPYFVHYPDRYVIYTKKI